MAQARPGTTVHVVPACGHLAVLEQPDAAAAALRAALASL
jgi:pimeloyl-ACP methyl ester carboxylesterase